AVQSWSDTTPPSTLCPKNNCTTSIGLWPWNGQAACALADAIGTAHRTTHTGRPMANACAPRHLDPASAERPRLFAGWRLCASRPQARRCEFESDLNRTRFDRDLLDQVGVHGGTEHRA